MTLVVVNFTEHQALALVGAVLIGLAIGYVVGVYRGTARTNREWFAERERVHQENAEAAKLVRIDP